MYRKTIQNGNMEMCIVNNDDNIVMDIMDNLENNLYRETFTNEYVYEELKVNNLMNFYNIICYSLENDMISLCICDSNVLLRIEYNNVLVYIFELVVPLSCNRQLMYECKYIKQMEGDFEELKKISHIHIAKKVQNYYNEVDMYIPIYFDVLKVSKISILEMPNKENNYCVYYMRYDYSNKTLDLILGKHGPGNISLNISNFLLLKPKKIEFIGISYDQIDFSCFPKER